MAVVQSFPLLNLPLLAINKVINCMIPAEQICFSLISMKSEELIKRKHTIDLEINAFGNSINQIHCKNQHGSRFLNEITDKSLEHKYRDLKLQKFDDEDVLMKLANNCYMITLWENRIEGIQKFMALLFNLFRIRKFTLVSEMMHKEDVFKIMKQFQELKLKFKVNVSKIEIYVGQLDNNICRYILENFNDVPELRLSTGGVNYEHNNVRSESCFKTNKAGWLTLNNLDLFTKYNSITLHTLEITNHKVNQFLKKWMESSTMKTVVLTVKSIDLGLVLRGLPVIWQYKELSIDRGEREQRVCFEIHRKDGVKANLWKYNEYFVMQTY